MLPSDAMESAISRPSSSAGKRLQIAEARRAHVHAIRLRRSVAHDVVADLAARRFDRLIHFAGRNAEAFGHDLEVIDERFHLRLHLFALRQHHLRRVGLPGAFRHPFQRLLDDARALPHLFQAHAIPRVHVVFGVHRDFEIELFVARIRLVLRTSHFTPGGANHRTGDAQIQHVFERNECRRPCVRTLPDRIRVQQILRTRPPCSGNALMNLPTTCCQPRGGSSARPPMRM